MRIIAVIAVALIVAAPAAAWTSNTWESPTGNIVCHFNGYHTIQCGTRDTGWVATVSASAATSAQYGLTQSLARRYGPILEYGESVTADGGRLQCLSTVTSMRCVNASGSGFWIARTGVKLVGPASLGNLR
jgi:hypothetical protein